MALIKPKIYKGFTASYWRIIQANTNMDRDDVVITLGLYKDKATRDEDHSAILDSYIFCLFYDNYSDPISAEGMIKDINLQACYNALCIAAHIEAQKPIGERDEILAWFADAEDDF